MPLAVDSLSVSQQSTWAEINLSRLTENLKALKIFMPFNSHVLAVIKANAYGHGLIPVARALADKVEFLGVSSMEEAMDLKENDITTRIFIFGRIANHQLSNALKINATLSVSSLEEAEEISSIAGQNAQRAVIHIKVDTGMGRLGIPFQKAQAEIEKIAVLPHLYLEGLYTHMPTAEKADGFSQAQLRLFASLIEELKSKGIVFRYRHALNSAGILKVKHPALNLFRPGLMLYGVYPDSDLRKTAKVLPVLSFKSRLILVKELSAGQSSGYGRDFIAREKTNVGILPVGYSLGYPFHASNRSQVLYRGKRFPIAGRVSMDFTAVNFGNQTPKAGDEVTLIGEDGPETLTAEDLAQAAQTIPYEIITRLSPSVPRIYQ